MFYPFELEQYLEHLLPERDPLMVEMESRALKETIPIVTPAVGNYLAQLIKMSKAKNCLEIGTAIGYSTLWLAKAIKENHGHITTIDLNYKRQKEALDYFARAGLSDNITSLLGDARDILPELKGGYDFIFVDGAKGEYQDYLDLILPKLVSGGVLVVDNVLFRGWVIPGASFEAKYERMIGGLRDFLRQLCQNKEMDTSILPFGDGLAISIKKEK